VKLRVKMSSTFIYFLGGVCEARCSNLPIQEGNGRVLKLWKNAGEIEKGFSARGRGNLKAGSTKIWKL